MVLAGVAGLGVVVVVVDTTAGRTGDASDAKIPALTPAAETVGEEAATADRPEKGVATAEGEPAGTTTTLGMLLKPR